jgi:hypothetical protein
LFRARTRNGCCSSETLPSAAKGVLLDGMAFPAQTASIFASETGRGCSWEQITSFDLTAQRAAMLIGEEASGIDVAVIALGIPDVLLVTGHAGWNTHIRGLIEAIRTKAGCQTRIVLTGLSPMDRFQPMPATIKHALALQVARLDGVSAEVAADLENVAFVPFPVESFGKMNMRDAFSFRAMHHLWAAAIAPHLVDSQITSIETSALVA